MSVAPRVAFVVATSLTVLIAPQLFTPRSSRMMAAPRIVSAHASLASERPAGVRETPQPHSDDDAIVDLYGNEVSDAVAKYELDPSGSLYELHSPQTELPRLASPKS